MWHAQLLLNRRIALPSPDALGANAGPSRGVWCSEGHCTGSKMHLIPSGLCEALEKPYHGDCKTRLLMASIFQPLDP